MNTILQKGQTHCNFYTISFISNRVEAGLVSAGKNQTKKDLYREKT